MSPTKPHFLLFCEGSQLPQEAGAAQNGRGKMAQVKNARWRFVLENVTSGEKFEATDFEANCTPDRASLVSVLRGLEALEQPSKVTLVTNNRYVFRGLRYGLSEWRENDFAWEHFGAVQPIRNADVWRRIDRTLSYHEVQCRWMSMDNASKSNHADSGEITIHSDSRSTGSVGVAPVGYPGQVAVGIQSTPIDATSHVAGAFAAMEETHDNRQVVRIHQSGPMPSMSERRSASVTVCKSAVTSGASPNSSAGATAAVYKDSVSSSAKGNDVGGRISQDEVNQCSAVGNLESTIGAALDTIESAVSQSELEVSTQAPNEHWSEIKTSVRSPSPDSEVFPTRQISSRAFTEPSTGYVTGLDGVSEQSRAETETVHPILKIDRGNAAASQTSPISKTLPESEDLTTEKPGRYSPRSVLFYPFAICWSICKRFLLAVWEAILRLDEGVESYMRCMLLLDPKQHRRRK